MTTIRTTCPNLACGDLELTIDQVKLEPAHYRFNCPQCGKLRILPASPRVIAILITAGVEPAPRGPITEEEIDLFAMELDLREGIER